MNHKNSFIKGRARQMLLGNYANTIIAILIAQIIPELALIPFNHFCSKRYLVATQTYIYYLAFILIMLVQIVLISGTFKLHLNIGRGKEISVSQMFDILNQRPDRVIAGAIVLFILSIIPFIPLAFFCYNLYLTVSEQFNELLLQYGSIIDTIENLNLPLTNGQLLVFCALMLFGAIVSIVLLLLFVPVLVMYADDEETGSVEAFKKLNRMLRGKRGKLVGLGFSFIGWMVLIALSFGVAALWVAPYLSQTITNFYLDCKGELIPAEAGSFYKEV